MSDFYCTFGYGHPFFPGYVRITAEDHHRAREVMVYHYGRKWCTSYSSKEFIHSLDDIERDHIDDTEKN